MVFAKQGYCVYIPDVDDRGVDLLVHKADVGYLRVQVKSLRGPGYVFMRKRYFEPAQDLALCLVLFSETDTDLFLIPSTQWLTPCPVFCDRDYENAKSAPEYGVNVSGKNMQRLNDFKLTR
jgi:hypothetical protein